MSFRHHRAHRDRNHGEIVEALVAVGATVKDTAAVGGGFPDLVVGFRGDDWLMEIKDWMRPASERALDEKQERFFDGWHGRRPVVVRTTGEALCVIGTVACPTRARAGRCNCGLRDHEIVPVVGESHA